MELFLNKWYHQKKECLSWVDTGENRIENHLREIAIDIIVTGEEAYRIGEINHWEWLKERKAYAEEREHKKQVEAKRQRLERIAQLEKARVDHLLGQAHVLHQAEQIRTYVAAVKKSNNSKHTPMDNKDLSSWASWALGQADLLDPITSGNYLERPDE